MAQGPVRAGTPGEIDLPFFVALLLPLVGKNEVWVVDPPHVVALRIGKLELERVVRRFAAHAEAELVVGRIVDRQRSAHRGVSGNAMEIEIETERVAIVIVDAAQRRRYLIGCDRSPGMRVVETVERARSARIGASQRGCE